MFKPIDMFKHLINENDLINENELITQSNLFLNCFSNNIFKEYNIKNYLSFKFILNKLIILNKTHQTFTKTPIIISPDIKLYNYIHNSIKKSFFGISNIDCHNFLFDKVGVLLGWFVIQNENNEIIEFL